MIIGGRQLAFEKNTARMRYREFRAQHLFIGAGVIEAGCKAIIGSRCKRSGMRHARRRVLDSARGQRHPGFAMLLFSGRFEDYWEARRPAA